MKNRILSSLLLFTIFISCGKLLKKDGVDSLQIESDYKNVAIDSIYQLSLPKHMKEMSTLNEEASLQYANIFKEVYTIVIHESKEDFVATFKDYGEYNESMSIIENYAEAQSNSLKETINNLNITPYQLTEINSKPARQVQMSGTVEGTGVSYVVSYVEGKQNLYMIMGWTLSNRFKKYESTLKSIEESFKLIND